jgi:hypothetical protein
MNKLQREQIDTFPDSPEATLARAQEAIALRCRIEAILRTAAVEIRPCKACSRQLFFAARPNGKLIPYEADGRNHFETCPHASKFKKAKQ